MGVSDFLYYIFLISFLILNRVQKNNNPKTKDALFKCLSYLIMRKVPLDPSLVIDELIKQQLLKIEDEYDSQKRTSVEKVIYCI